LCGVASLLASLPGRLSDSRARPTGSTPHCLPCAARSPPCCLPQTSANVAELLGNATHSLAKAAAELTDGTVGPECLPGSIRQTADRLARGSAGFHRLLGGLAYAA
jgi:hypothetical protein